MKMQFALIKLLKMFRISQAVLAKESGVGSDLINKIFKGERDNPTLDTIEKLANGLEKIDPAAKPMLYVLLQLPMNAYTSRPELINYQLKEPHEQREVINLFVNFFISRGLITKEAFEAEVKALQSQGINDVMEFYSGILQHQRVNYGSFEER